MPTVEALRQRFRFRDADQATSFLAAHRDTVGAAMEAANAIPRFLQASDQLILEVVVHPDENDDRDLFVVAPTTRRPEDVLPLFDRMQREWLIEDVRRTVGSFNLAVEYR